MWHGQGSYPVISSFHWHSASGEPSPAETNDIKEACIPAETHMIEPRMEGGGGGGMQPSMDGGKGRGGIK